MSSSIIENDQVTNWID